MGDSNPVDTVLEFLKKNKFTKAETALRGELGKRSDLNGFLQKLKLSDQVFGTIPKETSGVEEYKNTKNSRDTVENPKDSGASSVTEAPKELIVKEVDCGTGKNVLENKWKIYSTISDQNKVNASVGTSDKSFVFPRSSDDAELDLYPWDFGMNNDQVALDHDEGVINSLGFEIPGKAEPYNSVHDSSFLREKRFSWPGNASNASSGVTYDTVAENPVERSKMCTKDDVIDNSCTRFDASVNPRDVPIKGCSVKTVFPFSKGDTSTSYNGVSSFIDKKDGKRKVDLDEIRAAIKEQVDEVGRAILFGKSPVNAVVRQKEELPRLPPVRLKSEEKYFNIHWDEKHDQEGHVPKIMNGESSHLRGPFLDMPIGQEINPSGKMLGGCSWLSISQGIASDASDLVSGFATIGDGITESVEYHNEYWDSDEYDDDDDVGYIRQPIEDETWFLAHEIDYPSDNEKGAAYNSIPDPKERREDKNDDDEQSFGEEDSYFSGELYYQSKNIDSVVQTDDQSEPLWQGFVTPGNELVLGEGSVVNECRKIHPGDICVDDDQHDSVRSIGVGINSDAADIGSEVRESLVGGSSEGDIEYYVNRDVSIANSSKQEIYRTTRHNVEKNHIDGGFSFPASSCKSLMSKRGNATNPSDENEESMCNEAMLASRRRKSSDSSPVKSSRDENIANAGEFADSSTSSLSNYGHDKSKHAKKDSDAKRAEFRAGNAVISVEDEEAAAVQEQVKQIKAQEEEFETFNLKIVHRKNRTGFEEDKNFHVVLNSVLAGRYHVTEYLGSAAFSKAIQAHDLHTGMDVCVKIIKNNKDFFDQSLDEIKLLKYVNKHDPGDKYHILRLYDYFYYREHLLIVCELLKANLYEFHKFNRESGGEVYFTMPRLQLITIQCLEALEFLHNLGLIHCDLKPENILVKSYSRCEIKVIDLGSSCFETDHLCSYVQSRSYRAPEVILGLSYDKKIDIWSLGCILAELCTGNVLFQNDSPATLVARIIGIIGSIEQEMMVKGKDTYKYFTKNHMLYERNQESNRLEYLIPKKSSLKHRLPMGDEGFVEFVAHLLEVNPKKRPSAAEALKHPWLQYPYEPISS